MRFAFRADASIQIGTGHVMRCLTLADALRNRGDDCLFICRDNEGSSIDLVTQRGHRITVLPKSAVNSLKDPASPTHASWLGIDWASDAAETLRAITNSPVDWLVVDHYALDRRWESALRTSSRQIMVIDDLADRLHDCDLLLDQNLGRTEQDYQALVPGFAVKLIGPKHALLRPQFSRLRNESLTRRQSLQLKTLLISMGGIDQNNMTGKVLDCLSECGLPADLTVIVVMGSKAPWINDVKQRAKTMGYATQVLIDVRDMATLMTRSDLAIGAAGSTCWERCCLGLPTLMIVTAENQRIGAAALELSGAAILLRDMPHLQKTISELFAGAEGLNKLREMSHNAARITSGHGVNEVIAHLTR